MRLPRHPCNFDHSDAICAFDYYNYYSCNDYNYTLLQQHYTGTSEHHRAPVSDKDFAPHYQFPGENRPESKSRGGTESDWLDVLMFGRFWLHFRLLFWLHFGLQTFENMYLLCV